MFPTLKEPDALEIHPYGKTTPCVGDVVVCIPPDHTDYIVHRISRITQHGIMTRGDNAQVDDDWVLTLNEIEGRVTAAWRGHRRRTMHGGMTGGIQFHISRLRVKIVRRLSRFLKPLYHQVSKSGVIFGVLPRQLRPRIIRFNQQGTVALRLMWRNKVIGRYHGESGTWQIKFPFLLLVGPEYLSEIDKD